MADAVTGDARSPIRARDLLILMSHGLPAGLLHAARAQADRLGVGVDEALIASGAMQADELYRALARACGIPFLPEPRPVLMAEVPVVVASGVAPLQPGEPARWITAPTGPHLRLLLAMAETGRCPVGVAVTTPHRFERAVLAAGGHEVARAASDRLPDTAPARSCRGGPSPHERLLMLACLFAASFWLTFTGKSGMYDASTALCLMVAPGLVLRLGAVVDGGPSRIPTPADPPDAALPFYSVLVALHDEEAVVPQLCAALDRLDYPRARLEVLFLVEQTDVRTRRALARHLRPATQRIVVCPPGEPRTKPRALNVGLMLAKGDLVVVYDAEDEPATDQLRRAAAAFAAAGPDLACLQARLTIHNEDAGWLARLLRLEYAALFAAVLPGLARMHVPFPLGGTSNHFRRTTLRNAGGWDAWNVTEDADLGLRLCSLGYRLDVLDSETSEEAPATARDWFRQRSRWLKGWIKTSLVVSRRGGAHGPMGRFAAFAHGWSTVTTALAAPLTLLCLVNGLVHTPEDLEAQIAVGIGLVTFTAGLMAVTWPIFLGAARLRIALTWRDAALLGPYFILISLAGWAAVFDLLCAPQRWNKTPHVGSGGGAGASEHRFEFARGLRGRALEVEAADEATALVHQVDERGVVHGVAAAVERHLAGVDAPRLQHGIHRRPVAAEAADAPVEAGQVGVQHLGGVALRIHGDEEAAQPVALGAERVVDGGDLLQRRGADVRAVRETEEHQRGRALEVLLGHRPPVLVDEAERPADRARRLPVLARHEDHGHCHEQADGPEQEGEERQRQATGRRTRGIG